MAGIIEKWDKLSESDRIAFELVLDERIRQIEVEGWSTDFDDQERREGQLSAAGACYALAVTQRARVHAATGQTSVQPSAPHPCWPFSVVAWRPASMRRMGVKACALVMAEIARLVRAKVD